MLRIHVVSSGHSGIKRREDTPATGEKLSCHAPLARRQHFPQNNRTQSTLLVLQSWHLLWAFCDIGILGTPVGICVASFVGLAVTQCKSRSA